MTDGHGTNHQGRTRDQRRTKDEGRRTKADTAETDDRLVVSDGDEGIDARGAEGRDQAGGECPPR